MIMTTDNLRNFMNNPLPSFSAFLKRIFLYSIKDTFYSIKGEL
jgi:hypothetical protein